MQTVSYVLDARPGSVAILLVDFAAIFAPATPLQMGALMVPPNAILGPFLVPANGSVALPSVVPVVWPFGTSVRAQWITFDPVLNGFAASNLFLAVARS